VDTGILCGPHKLLGYVPTKNEQTERTENDELDQAIHGMLRDVHIASSWNADLGPCRGGGHDVATALFQSGRRRAKGGILRQSQTRTRPQLNETRTGRN
jgi:hypothetical protein